MKTQNHGRRKKKRSSERERFSGEITYREINKKEREIDRGKAEETQRKLNQTNHFIFVLLI